MTANIDRRSLWTWLVPQPDITAAQIEEAAAEHNVVAVPPERVFLASVAHILEEQYGLARSIRERQPVDAGGQPLPLYTYPAIHYLDTLDWSDADIFEFGAGFSTLWWATRSKTITAVDTDPAWADLLRQRAPAQVRVATVAEREIQTALEAHGSFDVIAIDCAANRFEVARAAVGHLKPGGIILLDNSEWYYNTAALLRDASLIQVDFAGFKPTEFYTSVTSLFIGPGFRARPKHLPHPPYPLGGKQRHRARPQAWDLPATPA